MTEEQLLTELRKAWTYRAGKLPPYEDDYAELTRLIENFYIADLVCERCAEYMIDAEQAIEIIHGGYWVNGHPVATFEDWETAVERLAKEHLAVCQGDDADQFDEDDDDA